ncbi:hypothetical protein EV421DRAFT_1804238 [Armillaria borealis]|uniref:Uncharacterized protein n=1 Tax=Armillaria borealis TaxID=47425 RepID=A0AA39JIZ6_9AGAR|nr:hypothetical protein EV421DRAFT_1804238 [Armillaria borealis]
MAPPSPHTPRLPVTEKHLNALRSHLCLEDPFDAAVWAVASVAWHSCSRLGELIFSKSKPFQPSRHVHRGCPRTLGKSSNDHEWMNLFIPFTKTTKYRGDWISITSTNDDLDPLALYSTFSEREHRVWFGELVSLWNLAHERYKRRTFILSLPQFGPFVSRLGSWTL